MAKKKMRSLLSQQRAKLKAQKAAKAAKQAKAPKLPPGKKGGPMVKSQSGALAKKPAPKALPGKPAPKALPAGKPGGALAKLKKPTGQGGLLTALTVGAAVGDAYRRTNRAKAVSSRGEGRATFNEKKKRMANIPPKEGTGKGSPTDKKPTSGTKTPKPASKPVTGASRGVSGGSKPSAKSAASAAYSKDARNKEYDRLRKAGKTKEAEALGKKIAADARKKAPENPYRVPQGAERKDRFSRDVAELKKMGKQKPAPKKSDAVSKYGSGSKKGVTRNTSLDQKKKKKSAALRAGYPGNRNY